MIEGIDMAMRGVRRFLTAAFSRRPDAEPDEPALPPPPADFPVVLRGYAMHTVDALVGSAARAVASADPARRAGAVREIDAAELEIALRGYDRAHVDTHLARLRAILTGGAERAGS